MKKFDTKSSMNKDDQQAIIDFIKHDTLTGWLPGFEQIQEDCEWCMNQNYQEEFDFWHKQASV